MTRPGILDLIFCLGLAMLGYGLWLYWPPLAFIAIGAILVGVALGAAILRNR